MSDLLSKTWKMTEYHAKCLALMDRVWSRNFKFTMKPIKTKRYSKKSHFCILSFIPVFPHLPRPRSYTISYIFTLLGFLFANSSKYSNVFIFPISYYCEVFYEWGNYSVYAYEMCRPGMPSTYLQCSQQS